MHTERTRNHHPPRIRRRGFTLIELMITLAIGAILLLLAAPSMGNLIARTRVSSAEGAVADSLRQARNAAIMANSRVVVCPSIDAQHCLPGYDWQHGWIIAHDADADGYPDAAKPAIAVLPALPTGARVITSVGRERLSFHPNGNSAGSNTSFTICHAHQADGKAVILSNAGRVRLQAPDAQHLQACLAVIP